jgi:CRISPR-associated protein Cas1
MDVPDLIPARMLNEFAYCSRLAYLEWVQGEFADNLETLEGRFGHRRVDRPDRRDVPEPKSNDAERDAPADVEPIHSRSIMLSAPGEGLVARLHVLDLQTAVAVPVDYKRGKVPDVPGGAWEPEQVQVCA